MPGYNPQPGFASFKKTDLCEVQETNGLLLPSQAAEDTLTRGTLTSVCNGDPRFDFEIGDDIVICPDDVLGILTEDGTSHYIVRVVDILGKVVGE